MATIYLDRAIGVEAGELSARWLRGQLDAAGGGDVTLQIHSEGGSVFEGLAMHDAIKSYPGKVTGVVSSMAFSAATIVLAACDSVEITENGYLMIHAPHTESDEPAGSEQQLLSSLERRMQDIYVQWSGQSRGAINQAMRTERFYNAQEAVRYGFADRIASSIAARAAAPYRIAASGNSAMAKWKSAIASTGKPLAEAMHIVEREQPQLRRAVIAEANKRKQ